MYPYGVVFECLKNMSITYLKVSVQIVLYKKVRCDTADDSYDRSRRAAYESNDSSKNLTPFPAFLCTSA